MSPTILGGRWRTKTSVSDARHTICEGSIRRPLRRQPLPSVDGSSTTEACSLNWRTVRTGKMPSKRRRIDGLTDYHILGHVARQDLAPLLKMLPVHPSSLTTQHQPRKTGYGEEVRHRHPCHNDGKAGPGTNDVAENFRAHEAEECDRNGDPSS